MMVGRADQGILPKVLTQSQVADVERIAAHTGRVRGLARQGLSRGVQLFAFEMPAWAFFLDFLIYPPVILACLIWAFYRAGWRAAPGVLALVICGLLVWSLAEYLIHRFGFHHAPILRPMHMAHHASPRALTGTPTFVTVAVFFLAVFWPLTMALPERAAMALTAGIMIGYLGYVGVHYLVHHRGSGGRPWMRRLIRLHALHHHDVAHNFGVTSAVWDRVFGTYLLR